MGANTSAAAQIEKKKKCAPYTVVPVGLKHELNLYSERILTSAVVFGSAGSGD